MNTILGLKQTVSQRFLENGTRIPVTFVRVPNNPVLAIKTMNKHGYWAVQLGCDNKKTKKNEKDKGTNQTLAPRFLKEVRLKAVKEDELPKIGDMISASMVLKPGDIIDVTGMSKGKGFAGGVKRHHFKGGPRTHGQSDRERAPGSIGQTTTPGRVYKGKRMAGKMGHEQVTIKNLVVVAVNEREVAVKGVVPGIPDSLLVINKIGEKKNFIPLLQEEEPTEQIEEIKSEQGAAVATA